MTTRQDRVIYAMCASIIGVSVAVAVSVFSGINGELAVVVLIMMVAMLVPVSR